MGGPQTPYSRDIEAALAETLSPDATLSKSTVSAVCAAVKDQFAAFQARDLSKVELTYVYVDASPFRYHHGAHAEPVLIAYGITLVATRSCWAWTGASGESHDACAGLLRDLVARGLRAPLLVICDGGRGPVSALDEVFARSARQFWLVHRSRNALAKVSKGDAEEFKADFWALFDDVDADPGFSSATNSSA